MNGMLIRVGADCTAGGGRWWAPVDASTHRFFYIPIPEDTTEFQPGLERRFDELVTPIGAHLAACPRSRFWMRALSARCGRPMHLDPDYEHLTYGDNGARRGKHLKRFGPGDVVAFYSSFERTDGAGDLVYALVGVYIVDEVVQSASTIPPERRHENAHTRKGTISSQDIVVRARPGVSGRCQRCIPIGENRDGSNYHLLPAIQEAWGGLVSAATGAPVTWLNRSGNMPLLADPKRFLAWWHAQNMPLVRSNFS